MINITLSTLLIIWFIELYTTAEAVLWFLILVLIGFGLKSFLFGDMLDDIRFGIIETLERDELCSGNCNIPGSLEFLV